MYFFFSSRRRHTRWTGDWSSDVCSSDLPDPVRLVSVEERPQSYRIGSSQAVSPVAMVCSRSEERRVGKECLMGIPRSYVNKELILQSSNCLAYWRFGQYAVSLSY